MRGEEEPREKKNRKKFDFFFLTFVIGGLDLL